MVHKNNKVLMFILHKCINHFYSLIYLPHYYATRWSFHDSYCIAATKIIYSSSLKWLRSGLEVDLEIKQQEQRELLPSHLYWLRWISSKLGLGFGRIQKWRVELVDNGHEFENDKPVNCYYWAYSKFAAPYWESHYARP